MVQVPLYMQTKARVRGPQCSAAMGIRCEGSACIRPPPCTAAAQRATSVPTSSLTVCASRKRRRRYVEADTQRTGPVEKAFSCSMLTTASRLQDKANGQATSKK